MKGDQNNVGKGKYYGGPWGRLEDPNKSDGLQGQFSGLQVGGQQHQDGGQQHLIGDASRPAAPVQLSWSSLPGNPGRSYHPPRLPPMKDFKKKPTNRGGRAKDD
jgi:hypothetical protein